MRREDELESRLAALAHALRVCEYLHALVYGVDAGGHERAGALDLDHADTARADFVYLLEVAEVGISMPAVRAASSMDMPLGTLRGILFILIFTISMLC